MRRVLVVAVLTGFIGSAAYAGAETGHARYGLTPAPDGFTRLDTETGDVVHCGPKDGVWACDRLTAAPPETERRLDALATEVRRLSAELAALAARVATPAPETAGEAIVASEPNGEVQSNRATRIAGEVVRRFLAMVHSLKHHDDA